MTLQRRRKHLKIASLVITGVFALHNLSFASDKRETGSAPSKQMSFYAGAEYDSYQSTKRLLDEDDAPSLKEKAEKVVGEAKKTASEVVTVVVERIHGKSTSKKNKAAKKEDKNGRNVEWLKNVLEKAWSHRPHHKQKNNHGRGHGRHHGKPDVKLGPKPKPALIPTPEPAPSPEPTSTPTPEPAPAPDPTPLPDSEPVPVVDPTPLPDSESTTEPTPTPPADPTPTPDPTPVLDTESTPVTDPTPSSDPEPTPASEPEPQPDPAPAPEPELIQIESWNVVKSTVDSSGNRVTTYQPTTASSYVSVQVVYGGSSNTPISATGVQSTTVTTFPSWDGYHQISSKPGPDGYWYTVFVSDDGLTTMSLKTTLAGEFILAEYLTTVSVSLDQIV